MQARTLALGLIAVGVLVGCSASKHEQVALQAVGARSPHELDLATVIVRNRLDLLGIKSASIEVRGSNRLVIETGRRLSSEQKRLLARTGSLAFYDLEANLAAPSKEGNGYPRATTDLFELLRRTGPPGELLLVDRRGRILAGPETSRSALFAMASLRGEVPKAAKVLSVPPNFTLVSCDARLGCPGQRTEARGKTFYYLLKRHPTLTGADLKPSSILAARGTQAAEGNGFVQLAFTRAGNRKFRDLTRKVALRGQALANAAGEGHSDDQTVIVQFAQHFAIVLDGRLGSTPYIDYKANPNGIDAAESGAEISNMPTYEDAKDLAVVLASGALPFHFALTR